MVAFSTCIYLDDAISSYIKLYSEFYTKYIDEHEKYLTECMNVIISLEDIARSDNNLIQIVEICNIRLKFEEIMLGSTPLNIQNIIVTNLYNYHDKHYEKSQFDEIKNRIEKLNKVDKSYEGIVDIFRKEAHSLDTPIEYLREFSKDLEILR